MVQALYHNTSYQFWLLQLVGWFGLAVIMLFGRQGLITHEILGLNTGAIYGLNGMAVAQIFGFFPFAYEAFAATH